MSKIVFEVVSFLEIEVQNFDRDRTDAKQHRTSRYSLEVSDNLREEAYKDSEGKPTLDGCNAIKEVLVTSLAANIHYAHQMGLIDSAKHLRDVISSLEQLFITQGVLGTSTILDDGSFNDVKYEPEK
jgi:uncharacterized protein YlaN (UPF0358 family)